MYESRILNKNELSRLKVITNHVQWPANLNSGCFFHFVSGKWQSNDSEKDLFSKKISEIALLTR